nr:MAG TPA: hypothetical protein [Caudoviricetes sp.]
MRVRSSSGRLGFGWRVRNSLSSMISQNCASQWPSLRM